MTNLDRHLGKETGSQGRNDGLDTSSPVEGTTDVLSHLGSVLLGKARLCRDITQKGNISVLWFGKDRPWVPAAPFHGGDPKVRRGTIGYVRI
jgi:hypothetical protein